MMLMPAPAHLKNSDSTALGFSKSSPGDSDVQPKLRTTGRKQGQFTAITEQCLLLNEINSCHDYPTKLPELQSATVTFPLNVPYGLRRILYYSKRPAHILP